MIIDYISYISFSRRILREINTLRAQLKRRNSLDYANASLNNELHAYSDTDACHTGLYPSSPGLSSSMNRLEQRYTQTLPHQRSSSRHDLSSYPQYQINQTPRTRPHQMRRAGSTETNPYLEQELQTLISRKHHLESRIDHLQQSKEELTTQLDTLGKILRYSPQTHQRSATASPHGRLSVSPSRMVYQTGHTNTTNSRKINQNMSFRSYSTPPTPVHDPLTPTGKFHLGNRSMILFFSSFFFFRNKYQRTDIHQSTHEIFANRSSYRSRFINISNVITRTTTKYRSDRSFHMYKTYFSLGFFFFI